MNKIYRPRYQNVFLGMADLDMSQFHPTNFSDSVENKMLLTVWTERHFVYPLHDRLKEGISAWP